MLADNAGRFGLVVAATLAITACGSSTKRAVDARDSGTHSPDLGLKGDLRADSNPVYEDAADDAGVVTADASPDTPALGLDSARLDITTINDDVGTDLPILGLDSAGRDSAIINEDAGLDGNIVRKDTAVDGVALAGAVDSGGDGSILNLDGGGADSGGAASLTIRPTQADFGIVWPLPSKPIVFTVTNVGSAPSGTFTATISTDSWFRITSNTCDKPLPAGQSCQVAVVFDDPGLQGLGSRTGILTIVADGIPGGRFTAPLSGDDP